VSRKKERRNNRVESRRDEQKRQYGSSKGYRKTQERDRGVMGYYKSFSKKPSSFREMYESHQDRYSSSDEDEYTSSSDDFPEPNSPRRKIYQKDHDDFGTLFDKVHKLQRHVYQMDLKLKKYASKRN